MPRLEDMTEEEQDALRDRFAMAALTGVIAQIRNATRFNSSPDKLADTAFTIADAMMEARDAQRGDGDG